MSEKIIVPVLGESITEATVSKWLKKEGETVEIDEPIVELETDKVNLEVPSPVSGTLKKIDSKDGSIVEVGAVLGSVSESSSKDKKNEIIEKLQVTPKETQKDNVVNLETQKKEPKIFEEKNDDKENIEKPLVLINEVEETKFKSLSRKQLIGGCIGIFGYIIVKEIGDWGWHYGDIVGLFLLAFLPGALFIGGMLEDG